MIRVLFFVFVSGMVVARSFEPYRVPLGSSVWGYFTPPMLKKPQQFLTPMEAMVSLTNDLGVAILQDHSYSRGNFAFSPYGVASVLVVLYEGARCESANQIHRAVGFPSNKDVLRTGFRDIHRHLRSYFSHEGFLSGITLNKNDSDLKPEYKKVLKYYGYDIDLNVQLDDDSKVDGDAKPSTQGTQPTKASGTTATQPNSEKPSLAAETINEEMKLKNETGDSGVKNPEKSTEKENAERENEPSTTALMTTVRETLPTTEKESTEGEKELLTTTSVTTVKETTPTTEESAKGDSELDASTALNEELITGESVSADQTVTVTSEPTTVSNTEEPTTAETENSGKKTKEELSDSTTALPEDEIHPEFLELDDNKRNKSQKTLESEEQDTRCKEEAGTNERSEGSLCKEDGKEKPKEAEAEAAEGVTESEASELDNGMLIPQPGEESTHADVAVTDSNFFQFTTKNADSNERTGVPLEEASGRKSLSAPNEAPMRMKQIRKMFDSKYSIWEDGSRKKRKRTRKERYKRTIADYLKWPLDPDLSLQLQNGMYDTHISKNAEMYKSLPRRMFLVDGAMDTPVPVMTYTNVFPYGYVPRLHAKALEFPLDDVRYKLLIVLPVERRGLRQLIYDLTDFSVRDILKCLRPTRVEATIPTFMVEGFVILTSSLQKLGIWDVFDPRKANLSGMSVDPELYVRNVEQSVTVVIRNYVEILDIQTRTMAARYLEFKFEATHPFVYFVLDTTTNVALMAGQMLDPLNSRIY